MTTATDTRSALVDIYKRSGRDALVEAMVDLVDVDDKDQNRRLVEMVRKIIQDANQEELDRPAV
jgi:hypothetical protein